MKLIFVRNKTWTSRVIRLVQGWRKGKLIAPWSHVAIITKSGNHVMDSFYLRNGITPPRTLASFIEGFPDNSGILEIPTDPSKEDAAYSWMEQQIGLPYGNEELKGYITGKNTYIPGKGMVCFHFVASALNKAGYSIDEDRVDCYRLLDLVK
ncbi:hypothetical protein UFOVP273_13 [uncultured Caudovirales phage]|uniref:Uncharacterized protein n=1 Tax=uncultured Caudovirales phage TaxID=2100421 RepID=A0A6J5LIU9_9CAUD|nr:hypothetical protein UFOVP273_13 [uncultured Caudovirales phage]